MIAALSSSFGLVGAALIVGFAAGMFPLLSIEAFVVAMTLNGEPLSTIAGMVAMGALGHQLAKTVAYYAGDRVMAAPTGKMKARLEKAQRWVERWNRWPNTMLFAASTVGVPPLYALAFVARPMMHMAVARFTAISLLGRVLRFAVLVSAARLW